MRLKTILLIIPLLAVGMTACASRGPTLEAMDQEALFQYGMERLRDEDWSGAIAAFERFTFTFPDNPRVAEARFRMGEAYAGRGEYVTAAMELNRLASDFPAGPWADDARFAVCNAYYELSPAPPRDQQYTATAIDHCRSLTLYYPESEYVPRAQEVMQELVNKLAQKDFETAEYYFRRRAYHSANIYYEGVAADYPETPWAPRALLRLHESYTILGYEEEAQEVRERLLRDFPSSPEAQQIDGSGITADSRP
ncbi:MAG TPA: outer membrane protein assembly factor BamD [Longimicrobiales bacterium]|nr:outer membrane protein assembly factor BamD [Longimicrobiales bacterium]